MTRPVNVGILGCINLHTPRYLESILKSPRAKLVGISEEGAAAAIGERTAEEVGVPFFGAHDSLLEPRAGQ